ncbi:MAG: type II toxin-antitoxin system VapC family toxin [Spirochaetia bacterium]|jgi:predicted nucleic acid-binding protein
MNVVDSSAWLEYLAAGPNASFFSEPIENIAELIVPAICLYEVFKRIVQQRSENEALQVVAVMQQGKVVELDSRIALSAARISLDKRLPMADSVMLATARMNNAVLWTQDSHFEGIENVKYRKASA